MRSRELPTGNPPTHGRVVLWGAGASADALIGEWNISIGGGYYLGVSMGGILTTGLQLGRGGRLRAVTFHLANFPNYIGKVVATGNGGWRAARTTWIQGEWQVTIDNLAETDRLSKELRQDAGYAITHVGRLERVDGATFSSRRSRTELDRLGVALSFARGGWSYPTLLVGENEAGTRWEDWSDRVQSSAVPRWSWFPGPRPDALEQCIPGFVARLTDRLWSEPLRRAATFYVDGNQTSRAEIAIVTAQSALELLAWAVLVQDRGLVSAQDFSDPRVWNAARRIRELLAIASIPTATPPGLGKLATMPGPGHHADGPERITFVRNRIVHPPKKAVPSWIDSPPAIEAMILSLYYLELVILYIVGYRGQYQSRVHGAVQTTPW